MVILSMDVYMPTVFDMTRDGEDSGNSRPETMLGIHAHH
jgi:hypothetical protein